MAGITGTYDKIDGLAKEIAGNQNYMSRLDKSSEEYEALKAKNNDLKEEFKETVVEFGKIYNNTELFNENKINEVKEYYFEKKKIWM